MNAPKNFSKIVGRKQYNTATATLIADNEYWDGHNWERHGRNTFLYRTPNGAYFTVTLTLWQGEQDTLTPVTQTEAIELFEGPLTEHHVEYAEAFPGVKVEEA
jgi:hypothetical protein